MFDLRDVTGLQFYNFVRLAFFILTVSSLVCLCYFVFNMNDINKTRIVVNSLA